MRLIFQSFFNQLVAIVIKEDRKGRKEEEILKKKKIFLNLKLYKSKS